MFLTLVLSFLRRMFAMVSDGDHFGLDILLVSCLFEYSDRAAVDASAKSFIAAFFCITSLMILRSCMHSIHTTLFCILVDLHV